MKFGLPAKLAIFLLMASPFSYSASNDGSSCREKAEYSETVDIRFVGSSSCSTTGSYFTGNDHCTVKAKPSSTCELDQYGVWVGKGYYFTGCLAGTECGNQPDPDPEPDPDPPPLTGQLTPIPWRQHNSTPWQPHGGENYMIQHFSDEVRLSFGYQLKASEALSKNDAIINSNILALSKSINSLGNDVDATRSASELATSAARSARDSAESASDYSFASLNLTRAIEKDLKSLTEQGVKKTDFDKLAENIKLNNDAEIIRDSATSEKLDEIHSKAIDAASASGTAVFDIGALNTDVIRYAREDADRDFDLRNTVIDAANTVTGNIDNSLVDVNSNQFLMRRTLDDAATQIDNIYAKLDNLDTGNPPDPDNPDPDNPNPPTGNNADVVYAIEELEDELKDSTDDIRDSLDDVDRSVGDVEDAVDDVASEISRLGSTISFDVGYPMQQGLSDLSSKLDGLKGSLDSITDTSGFGQDLADGTAQGKSDLNELLDGYNADTMLTDRFKQITDTAEKTMTDSGLGKFSDPSKFIDDSGMVKPDDFDDLVAFAQRQACSPIRVKANQTTYDMDICKYAGPTSDALSYVIAVLTAIFSFVMISQTLINERLS